MVTPDAACLWIVKQQVTCKEFCFQWAGKSFSAGPLIPMGHIFKSGFIASWMKGKPSIYTLLSNVDSLSTSRDFWMSNSIIITIIIIIIINTS